MQNITALFNTLGITSGHLEASLLGEVSRLHSDINAVEALLEGAPGVKVGQQCLDAALLRVAKSDRADIAQVLLAHGARTETWDAVGDTPLLLACRSGSFLTARLLVAKGAHLNARDTHGQTPLILAAYGGNASLVSELIARGASVDVKADAGDTALSAAKYRGNREIVQILKDAMPKATAANSKKQRQPAL
ncbi:MAG: ankyrin repeat domain-containing protein [Alphaproteobacteria bacterium]